MIKKLLLKNSLYLLMLAITPLSGYLAGCKKDAPPPPPAAPVAAKPAAVPAKPVQKPVSSVVSLPSVPVNQFDFSKKKDPFKPYVAAKPVESLPTQKQKIREGLPIHQYDVSQFKLIGVVTGAGESKAMVVAPNGKGYVLKTGMSIGKNDGKVTSITSAGVAVTEQFKDDNGKVRREVIKIALPRKQ